MGGMVDTIGRKLKQQHFTQKKKNNNNLVRIGILPEVSARRRVRPPIERAMGGRHVRMIERLKRRAQTSVLQLKYAPYET